MKKTITTVITDLDDTLWDWVGTWYSSFSAMLSELEDKSRIPRERLISEFREIHQRYGTSEYAFAIEELPCLREKHPAANLRLEYASAIDAYRLAREQSLRMFPGVMYALVSLRRRGCVLVGYTESMQYYSNFRLKFFGLDGILDYLYSPADHDIPEAAKENNGLSFSGAKTLDWTIQKYTPAGELKPNPHILGQIIQETGADRSATLYIGDKLSKDILMARQAGVLSAFAKYGESHNREEYALLKQVTHWTPDMVSREKDALAVEIKPDIILSTSLSEIFDHFDFQARPEDMREDKKLLLSIWEKTIDVQQHFNDLALRIRNFALTILAALLTLTGLSLKEQWNLSIGDRAIPLAIPIVGISCLIWLSFYFMDRFWYHRLLYGAVQHGVKIESILLKWFPGVNLTQTIGSESPLPLFKRKIRSRHKMDFFYLVIFACLVALGAAIYFGHVSPTPNDAGPT